MTRLRALATGAALVAALCTTQAHAADPTPPPYRGCVVYEDYSYTCGWLLPVPGSGAGYGGPWFDVDYTRPHISGCIPDSGCTP